MPWATSSSISERLTPPPSNMAPSPRVNKDGTPDKRYSRAKSRGTPTRGRGSPSPSPKRRKGAALTEASFTKKDGTPDKRYTQASGSVDKCCRGYPGCRGGHAREHCAACKKEHGSGKASATAASSVPKRSGSGKASATAASSAPKRSGSPSARRRSASPSARRRSASGTPSKYKREGFPNKWHSEHKNAAPVEAAVEASSSQLSHRPSASPLALKISILSGEGLGFVASGMIAQVLADCLPHHLLLPFGLAAWLGPVSTYTVQGIFNTSIQVAFNVQLTFELRARALNFAQF